MIYVCGELTSGFCIIPIVAVTKTVTVHSYVRLLDCVSGSPLAHIFTAAPISIPNLSDASDADVRRALRANERLPWYSALYGDILWIVMNTNVLKDQAMANSQTNWLRAQV